MRHIAASDREAGIHRSRNGIGRGRRAGVMLVGLAALLAGATAAAGEADGSRSADGERVGPDVGGLWVALHTIAGASDNDLRAIAGHLPALRQRGMNVLILEINYHFRFQSHPELRQTDNTITREAAGAFAAACREHDVKLVIQFQCLGHQSFQGKPLPLLARYPELRLTPDDPEDPRHTLAWDPLNPKTNRIVFALIDELIEAFEPTAFHVGLDEVFGLGSERSPSTRGRDPGELFARVVKDLHGHVVGKHGLEMMMWADRLIDGKGDGYHAWESSHNGTYRAIAQVPRDIILCPWHYQKRDRYPSIGRLLERGFRVLPASYEDKEAARRLMEASLAPDDPRMLGHLFTTWNGYVDEVVAFEPARDGMRWLKRRTAGGRE